MDMILAGRIAIAQGTPGRGVGRGLSSWCSMWLDLRMPGLDISDEPPWRTQAPSPAGAVVPLARAGAGPTPPVGRPCRREPRRALVSVLQHHECRRLCDADRNA